MILVTYRFIYCWHYVYLDLAEDQHFRYQHLSVKPHTSSILVLEQTYIIISKCITIRVDWTCFLFRNIYIVVHMYNLFIISYLPLLPSMVHVEEGLESFWIVKLCGLPSTRAQRQTVKHKIMFFLWPRVFNIFINHGNFISGSQAMDYGKFL